MIIRFQFKKMKTKVFKTFLRFVFNQSCIAISMNFWLSSNEYILTVFRICFNMCWNLLSTYFFFLFSHFFQIRRVVCYLMFCFFFELSSRLISSNDFFQTFFVFDKSFFKRHFFLGIFTYATKYFSAFSNEL